ncbi:RHS repeat-associated core domain-containing protein, partial [Apibacter mensalis]|uniref:RHS repeat-associated core domain-containing protein n=1 Tax=Apibacter mensalis TaxID=1586267 RepID=UPI0026F05ED0
MFIEERNNSWNSPYLFNGKELDEETGLYYYGARYYNPRESVWLSADPLSGYNPNNETEHYIDGQ